MSKISFSTSVVSVHADFLKAPLQLALVAVANTQPDEKYFHCVHKNAQIHRLLVEERFVTVFGSSARALRKSDILKTLKQLKDDEWNRKVKEECGHSRVAERYTRGTKRSKVLTFDATVPIVAPRVSAVESMTLMVVCSKPGCGLVMLLTPEVIEYLRNVVSAQLDAGGISTSSHVRANLAVVDRVDTEVEHLYWSYAKNKFRAVFYTVDADGSKKRKELLTESKDLAVTFVNTGIRPPKGMPPAHVVGCRCNACRSRRSDDASPEPPEAEDEDEASSSGNDDRSPAEIV